MRTAPAARIAPSRSHHDSLTLSLKKGEAGSSLKTRKRHFKKVAFDNGRKERIGEKWQEVSQEFRVRKGVANDYSPWVEKGKVLRGLAATPARKDLIDLGFIQLEAECPHDVDEPDFSKKLIDCSESHKRATRGKEMSIKMDRMPLVSSSTEVYMYGRDRVLVAEDKDALRAKGFYVLAHTLVREIYETSLASL